MCLNPIRLPHITGTESAIIPCGKCAECLANKANDLTVRVVREAEYFKDFFFTTLTYDNEHIPMQVTECSVSEDFEEVVECQYISDDTDLRNEFFTNAEYVIVFNKEGRPVKRYQPYKFDEEFPSVVTEPDVLQRYKIAYYTLDNEDFKKFLKSSRMKYLRTYGQPLPKFKYLCVPEYGGASYRPHYHILWLGLNEEQVHFMVNNWKKGSVADVQRVKYTMEDMTAVAHYVSQYACKGSFDVPFIRDGYCKKPRRCFSLQFGIGDEEELLRRESWWKCEDIHGPIDVNDLSQLDEVEKKALAEDILDRRYYDLCGFKYPIPQYIKKRMFYVNRNDINMKKITESNLMTYEQKQELYKQLNRPRIKRVRQPDGTFMYKFVKPSPYSKVASALQNLVASALFQHLNADSNRRMAEEYAGEVSRLVEITPANVAALQTAWASSQMDKQKVAELHTLNKIANSAI